MKEFVIRQFNALKATDNHLLRHTVGVLLVIGGLLGFLPVLGYWMLPLGLALLAVDFPWARRVNRRLSVYWGRTTQRWSRFTGRPLPARAPSPRARRDRDKRSDP